MGTNECSQPASKSSWDSQDFGDVSIGVKNGPFSQLHQATMSDDAWSGTMCECVAFPIWTCIIFKGIIIVTICIIIIMWQFYVRSLTRLQYQTHSRIWVHLLFCSGGRNNNDNILYAIPKVISWAHIS